ETKYFGFNESENDRGSRDNSRIYKSWRELKKSPLGLDNSGVTCYMNAAIQAFMHIPAMAHYLKDVHNGKYKDIISPNSVTAEIANLYSKLFDGYKKKKSIFPTKIIKRLDDINCMMSEWQQEDSHEYFMSLMGRLQEDSIPKGAKMNSSILYDIFSGKINQKVTCKSCNHVSTTIQEFSDLSVSLKESKKEKSSEDSTIFTLKDSIKDFFSPELIKVDSKTKAGYNCEKCKKTSNAVKISTIDDAPEYLTIHLKRFKFQGSKSHKIKEPISYPMDLDISKFSSSGKDPIKYRLIGVIIHAGRTVSSGHYIAICQQPNGTWAEYDDDFVRKISEKSVLKEESAYMLIYSRLKVKS
ncbi:cysteine proteinase, partial [Nadsonia fulvescens var. elongata DSM 6958]